MDSRRSLLVFALSLGSASVADGATSCRPIAGTDPLLVAGRIVIVGERHGTRETPEALGDLACLALRKGLPVRVGFEFELTDLAHLQRFLASSGGADDRTAVISALLSSHDGRGSESMLALLDRLRRWSRAGARVSAFTFKKSGDDTFAANIAGEHERAPGDLVLVLVGSNHARLNQDGPSDLPMGWHLKQRHLDVVSLLATHAGGSAWDWEEHGSGVYKHAPTEVARGRTPQLHLTPVRTDFSGTLFLGRIHASPEAKP